MKKDQCSNENHSKLVTKTLKLVRRNENDTTTVLTGKRLFKVLNYNTRLIC